MFDDKRKSISEQDEETRRPVIVPFESRIDRNLRAGIGGERRGLQNRAEIMGAKQQDRAIVQGRITGPVQMLNRIFSDWELRDDAAAIVLGYEASDARFVADILNGMITLSGRDVKDRVAYLITIYNLLNKLFGSDNKVICDWLRTKQSKLKGLSPIDYILRGSMEKLLHVKYLVELMAGHY